MRHFAQGGVLQWIPSCCLRANADQNVSRFSVFVGFFLLSQGEEEKAEGMGSARSVWGCWGPRDSKPPPLSVFSMRGDEVSLQKQGGTLREISGIVGAWEQEKKEGRKQEAFTRGGRWQEGEMEVLLLILQILCVSQPAQPTPPLDEAVYHNSLIPSR